MSEKKILILLIIINEFLNVIQCANPNSTCCKCKDISPPATCVCDQLIGYCFDEDKCIDMIEEDLYNLNYGGGFLKKDCLKKGFYYTETVGSYKNLFDNKFSSDPHILIDKSCFIFEDFTFQNQITLKLMGKDPFYMKTKEQLCVNDSNIKQERDNIGFCCFDCNPSYCLDKEKEKKCVKPNLLYKESLEYNNYYYGVQVNNYRQKLIKNIKYFYSGISPKSTCLKGQENDYDHFIQCNQKDNLDVCVHDDNGRNLCLKIQSQDNGPIGKTIEDKCVFKDKYYKSIKYCNNDLEIEYKSNYCRYTDTSKAEGEEKYMCVNIDDHKFGDKIRGVDEKGNCLTLEQEGAFLCSFGYCKLIHNGSTKCVQLSLQRDEDKVQRRISSFGFFRYCGVDDRVGANACAPGFCIPSKNSFYRPINYYDDYTEEETEKSQLTKCQPLNNQRIGKKSNHECISGQFQEQSDSIIECTVDYCIESIGNNKFKCSPLQDKIPELNVKLSNHSCSSYQKQFTEFAQFDSIGCSFDYLNPSCLYTDPQTNLSKCRYFSQNSYTDASGQTQVLEELISKGLIGRAQDDDTCLRFKDEKKANFCSSEFCLNNQQQCQQFDPFMIGKNIYSKCLKEADMSNEAVLCAISHCLTNNLQEKQYGQKKQIRLLTGKANPLLVIRPRQMRMLKKKGKGSKKKDWSDDFFSDFFDEFDDFGQDEDYDQEDEFDWNNGKGSKEKDDSDQKDPFSDEKEKFKYCKKIDKENLIVGVEKLSGQCIYVGDDKKDAKNCIMNEYCLKNIGGKNSCVEMDNQIYCADANQYCIGVNELDKQINCRSCKKGNCLQLKPTIECKQFNYLGSKTCMSFEGQCQRFEQSNCRSCPFGTCLDLKLRTCIDTSKFKLKNGQCLKYKREDQPCQFYNLDNYEKTKLQCTHPSGRCIDMEEKDSICQSCPKFYNQPGDTKCYGLNEVAKFLDGKKAEGIQKKQFGIDVIYQSLNGCPVGQQSNQGCQNQKWCTQCLLSYILYRNSDLKIQTCLKIVINDSDKSRDETNFYNNSILKTVVNCDYESIYQQNRKFIYKDEFFYCYSFLSKYVDTNEIRYMKLFEETIIFELNQNQTQIVALESSKQSAQGNCEDGCLTCMKKKGQSICLKCKDRFTLNYKTNQCSKCPNQCINCFYGGYYNQETVNWSVRYIDLSPEQYTLLCSDCESNQNLVLKLDFSGCEKCGDNCKQCSWGNPNFNMTSLFILNQAYYETGSKQFLKIKKCLSCIDGFILNIDQETCLKKQQVECQEEIFFEALKNVNINKNTVLNTLIPFTVHQWFFKDELTYNYIQGCLSCIPTHILVYEQDSNTIKCEAQSKFNQIDLEKILVVCQKPILYVQEGSMSMLTCKECKLDESFNLDTQKCSIQCIQNVSNCIKCYNYSSSYKDQIFPVFQCTICKGNLIPTQYGCDQCPKECRTCIEGDEQINFTRKLTLERLTNTLDKRLTMANDKTMKKICTACKENYYFDYNTKKCVKVRCGKYCGYCYSYKQKNNCLRCDQISIMDDISEILGYLTDFYFEKSLKEINQMINYNEERNDCFICPLSCQGCQYYKLTSNPLSLYSAKCFACNHKILDSKIPSGYEWRFDSRVKRCVLCRIEDVGCFYQKKIDLYINCGSKESAIGQGQIGNPYNIQRSQDIDWDKVFVNEVDTLKALVIYNEIGLQRMEITLNFVVGSDECSINEDIVIESTLMQQIFTLREFILTIQTVDQPSIQQRRAVQLSKQIKIIGFTEIRMKKIDWNLNFYSLKPTGFIFDTPFISRIEICDSIFINLNKEKSGFTNLFDIQIYNLQYELIIKNVNFEGILLKQQDLIKLFQKDSYPRKNQINLDRFDYIDSFKILLQNLQFIKNTLSLSSFIRLKYPKIFFDLIDSKIEQNYMKDNTILFYFDQSANIGIIQTWKNVQIFNNTFENYFSFYRAQMFVRNEKNDILFLQNIVKNKENAKGFFQANKLWLSQAQITENNISQQVFITYLPQKVSINKRYDEFGEYDKIWEPILDKFYDFDSKINEIDRIYLQILDLIINKNTISREGTLLIDFEGQDNNIGKMDIRDIKFECDNKIIKNNFSNMINIKTIYQIYIERTLICNNMHSKFYVFNDIQILNINHIEIYQENVQNIDDKNIQYPQIIIGNIYKYLLLREINIRDLLIQTTIVKIIIDSPEEVINLTILHLTAKNNFLNQINDSEEINILSIYSHSNLNITIKSSQIFSNSLFSPKRILRLSSSGLLIKAEQSKLTLKDLFFKDNDASQGYNQMIAIADEILIKDSLFQNSNLKFIQNEGRNKFCEINGGAFYSQSSLLNIMNSQFDKSFAAKGGAIYWQPRSNAKLIIKNTRFKENEAQIKNKYSEGGSIYIESGNQNQLDIRLTEVFAENNFANLNGGFLSTSYSRKKVAVIINNSYFLNNFAINGGLINIDTSKGSKGYLYLESAQIYMDLTSISNKTRQIIFYSEQFNPFAISYISFISTQVIEFKEVSYKVLPEKDFEENILINQVLYQPIALFKDSLQVSLKDCNFSDTVVYQVLLDIYNVKDIEILKSNFLNIQSLRSYYIKNKELETLSISEDILLKILSDPNNYQKQKNSILILNARNHLEVKQSSFERIVCPNCIQGPIYVSAQTSRFISSEFIENQGRNGGAINIQYSIKKLQEINKFKIQQKRYLNSLEQYIYIDNNNNKNKNNDFQGFTLTDQEIIQQKQQNKEYFFVENTDFQKIFINNCNFFNNTAQNGGGIFVMNSYVSITSSSFVDNYAVEYGGAIFNSAGQFDAIQNQFLDQNEINDDKIIIRPFNIELFNSTLLKNFAKVGGAYYSNDKFPFINNQTFIYQNIGKFYGPDQQVNPWQMSVVYQGVKSKNNTEIIHNSGYIQDELIVYLLGNKNEQFKNFKKVFEDKEIEEMVYLNISYHSSNPYTLVTPTRIPFKDGHFNLTKTLQIWGTFGSTIILNLTCSKIQYPKYEQVSKKFVKLVDNFFFQIIIKILDNCPPGTKIQKQDGKYDYCQICYLKTYSLEIGSQTCHKCPISTAKCYQNIILIPDGYWRKSKQLSQISDCRNQRSNCLGDINGTDPDLELKKKINNWQNQFCSEGHIGALCEDCDLKGQFWIASYQKVSQFSCADCNSVSYNWFFVIISQAGQVLLTTIIVFSSIKYIQSKILAEYIMKMKLHYFGSSFEQRNRSSLYIKILINYFQIISCLSTFRLDIPNMINFFYKVVGNPLESVLYAQDCLIIKFFKNVDIIYFRLFISHAEIVFLIICLYICLVIHSCFTKTKIKLAILVCAINYCLYSNLPSMVNLIIGTISCIEVGGESYVKLFTSIECNSKHQQKSKLILWPLLAMWSFVIPLLQFLVLFIKRYSLNTISMKYSFGFLYNEYSQRCYWWETVKTYQKILIIIFLNLFEQKVVIKGCIILAIVYIVLCITQQCKVSLFYFIQNKYNFIIIKKEKPFLVPQLNFIDNISTFVCCITIAFGIILNNYSQSKGSEYLIYSIVGLINLTFLIYISLKILYSYWYLLKRKIKLPQCKSKIRDEDKYKLVQDKWNQVRNKISRLKQLRDLRVNQLNDLKGQELFNPVCPQELRVLYNRAYRYLFEKEKQKQLTVKQNNHPKLQKSSKKKKQKNRRRDDKQIQNIQNNGSNSTQLGNQQKQQRNRKRSFIQNIQIQDSNNNKNGLDLTKYRIKQQKSNIQEEMSNALANVNMYNQYVSKTSKRDIFSKQHLFVSRNDVGSVGNVNDPTQKESQIQNSFQSKLILPTNKQEDHNRVYIKPIRKPSIEDMREHRKQSIILQRRCILAFKIFNFIESNYYSSAYGNYSINASYLTEQGKAQKLFDMIKNELDALNQKFRNDKEVNSHIKSQKQELTNFFKGLSKSNNYSILIIALENIYGYICLEFIESPQTFFN